MIREAIAELIEPGEEKKELQILKMLNVVVTEAIKKDIYRKIKFCHYFQMSRIGQPSVRIRCGRH